MSRPKKGTKEGDIATKKWHATMEAKYGSPEKLHEVMRELGRKGGRNGHTGGFAANRELARKAGAKGGAISRRGPAKKKPALRNDKPVKTERREVTKEQIDEGAQIRENFFRRILGGKK